MKPHQKNAPRRRRAGKAGANLAPGWSIAATGVRLHELYAGFALAGVLAAQAKEPNTNWVRRLSWRIGCDMADEAVRLRRKER